MRIVAEDGSCQWVTLAEYVASVEPADWEEATWPAQEGGHTVYVHAIRT